MASDTATAQFFRWSITSLLVILPLAFVQLYFSGNWYAIAHSYSLAMLFGIISYTLFCCTLLMSTRLHFLDRLFGHDRVLHLHSYVALASIVTGYIHYLLKSEYLDQTTFHTTIGLIALAGSIALMLLSVLLMTAVFPFTLPVLSTIRVHIIKKLPVDYSVIKCIHNGFAIVVVFLLIHVYTSQSTQESVLRMFLMGLLAGITLIRYCYHKFLRPFINSKRNYRVTSIQKLSEDIIRLTASTTSAKRIQFSPGQFCYLKLPAPETGNEEHPFTISSASEEPEIHITVKGLGNYTKQLEKISKGIPAIFDGPYGRFTPRLDNRKKVFIAGGIGITPFFSILSSWYLKKQGLPETTLLWSVQRKAGLIDAARLTQLAHECPWFTFTPILTREQHPDYTHGRITLEQLTAILPSSDVINSDIYCCGPEAMIRNTLQMCKALGVPRKSIHFERFAL